MIVGDCDLTHDLDADQQKTLLDWVAAGHKLILRDSDMCNSSDYSFIPYQFQTIAVGGRGARGQVLSIVDPSTLGAGKSDPAHFLDTVSYVSGHQDLGDADIMQTDDLHWCGHLFARNLAGATGWAHTYTRWGRGLIIYDGLDRDDLKMDPPALNVVRYEYRQPATGRLPCNVRVASVLTLYPSADRKMAAGVPATLQVPMSLTYAAKAKGAADQQVALSITGDAPYRMNVSPATITMHSGQSIPVQAVISLPKGWSGFHAFTVTANGQHNAKSQTSITLDGSVALARAFQTQRRVRIYGIHFDVDSATILPQSETTISQIAEVLRANPSWRMRVEGYTDSDGGAAYNQGLSDRRAHSVVADLVNHYHIAASRLTAQGFGLTHPVAPNTTEGGKALNRRVELVRL
jgi:outer membrane protein OmpA-like peptidoglycan-associated protein